MPTREIKVAPKLNWSRNFSIEAYFYFLQQSHNDKSQSPYRKLDLHTNTKQEQRDKHNRKLTVINTRKNNQKPNNKQ